MWPYVPDFFHLVWCFQGSSIWFMLLSVCNSALFIGELHSIDQLDHISFIHLLMDIWVVFTFLAFVNNAVNRM